MDSTGAYSADRASALSGVPKSTIHYWARTELLVPSVSTDAILSFYPYLATEQLAEALDLERQLADNLAIPSAA